MLVLHLEDQQLTIDAGELVGYQVDGHECIHQKGSPGWRSSDTEMFPIIGPTAEARFQVQTPKDIAIQDQHGLLREMDYELVSQTDTEAVFEKSYRARTMVGNSKYPEKSNKQYLFWPYDFTFVKSFRLTADGLEIRFTVSGERDSPFMLGYHPAFKLHTANPVVVAGEKTITLDDILAVGSRALEVPDCTEIVLKDEKQLRIRTEGFRSFMLWTEVRNMVCIEPITFYPYAVKQHRLHEGFEFLLDTPKEFKVIIAVT
ncbi:aldose 1-epimerase [Flavobacteriaceae bacterium TP-CH-4]|uniref:Aldose 1-epimerase n=1 Tax=Pelagihabitans pacificus TaxID=2696054 RepID=A0A967APV4_9FLAO|nr:aldose 1-epimerase [Pelagihabitans pacificus]NHF58148.1 aldose 1-epimerase [Pelagihabitans pacificus]